MALIVAMATAATTGWMMTTGSYYCLEWVESAHGLAAHGLLALILLHVGGVALASVRHRENLIRGMVSGSKRAAGVGDVDD